MKLNGEPLPQPKSKLVVFPRGTKMVDDPENPGQKKEEKIFLAFECGVVTDFSEFERVCPLPKPPKVTRPNKAPEIDPKNPDYLKAMNDHGLRNEHWIVIQSLLATKGLEFEKVDLEKPETWHLWIIELKEAGLSLGEILNLKSAVIEVNGLDDNKLDEARQAFLALHPQEQGR